MARNVPTKTAIRDRVASELIEFAVIATYLFIAFSALAYLKAAILQAHGIAFAPFGFAAVKALICAKFVLIGQAIHIGEQFKTRPLIWPTLHKSIAFVVLLIVLNALEEVIVGFMHHRGVMDSLAELGGGTLDQLIATSVVVFVIFIPFFAFRELGEVVGERNLVRVFFLPRRGVEVD